eukprot:jgi/Chlat1/5723/Chrsp38S05557
MAVAMPRVVLSCVPPACSVLRAESPSSAPPCSGRSGRRSSKRQRRSALSCCASQPNREGEDQLDVNKLSDGLAWVNRVVAVSAVAAAANGVAAAPAEARTRRHLRQTAPAQQRNFTEPAPTLSSSSARTQAASQDPDVFTLSVDVGAIKRRLRQFTNSAVRSANRVANIRADSGSDYSTTTHFPTYEQAPPPPKSSAPSISGMDKSSLLVVAAAVGIFALQKFVGGSRSNRNARVVRDRSMGGKEVVVRDSPLDWNHNTAGQSFDDRLRYRKTTAAAKSVPSPLGPLGEDDFRSERARREREAESAALRADKETSASEGPLPAWWKIPETVFVTPQRRQAAVQAATATLKRMTDARLVGREFVEEDLMALNEQCRDYGVELQLETPALRDAIYRAAVNLAINAAEKGGTPNIASPADAVEFVSSFAHAISVPSSRAVVLVQAAVAAEVRNLLLQAAALVRQGRQAETVSEMMQLANILATFPPPPAAAEIGMVAGSLQSKISLPEREILYGLFLNGNHAPDSASTVREALGLDQRSAPVNR